MESRSLESLEILIKSLDERVKLSLAEAEKRNEQRFNAQQEAVAIALVSQEKAVLAAMAGAEKAVSKAETSSERRFESVNEFRKTLSDQTANFITRNEYATQNKALEDKLNILTGTRSSGLNSAWGYLIGAVGLGTGLAAIIHLIHG